MTSSSFFSFQEACRLSRVLAIDGVSSRLRTRPVSSSTRAKRPSSASPSTRSEAITSPLLRVLQARLDPDLRPGAHEAADERGRGLRLARHRLATVGADMRAVVAVARLVEDLVEPLRSRERAGRGGSQGLMTSMSVSPVRSQ